MSNPGERGRTSTPLCSSKNGSGLPCRKALDKFFAMAYYFAVNLNRENKMDNVSPNLSLEYRGKVVVATLTDEKILDEDQLQGLEGSFLPLIEQTPQIQLIIDFSNVKFLTSSVLGLLIRISKKVYETDGTLRLCSIGPKILDVFRITRLDKIFEIMTSVDDAMIGLKK